MKQVPDRKRLRREYLRRKGKQYLYASVGAVTFLCGYGLLCVMRHPILDGVRAHPDLPTVLKAVESTVFMLGIYFLLVREAHKMVQSAQNMAIPYVPPVTPNTLPADEILVRAAEEPSTSQSEVLLRAAPRAQEVPKEELLRVSQER